MNRSEVQIWLDGYVEAWRENDPPLVETLFSDDAVYRFRPYGGEGRVVEGLSDIVEAWIDESGAPAGWEASYETYAADGDRAVAVGTTRYSATEDQPEMVYHNCFLLRFAPDGRCAEFTEFWMLEPGDG
ncbi:MAG: nuclear transport factor 2 family protein [Acidimicrobiia bacterium]